MKRRAFVFVVFFLVSAFSLVQAQELRQEVIHFDWILQWPWGYDNVKSLLVKDGVIYAGTADQSLLVSRDTGRTWSQIAPPQIGYGCVDGLAKTLSGDILVGTDDGFYRSSDNGHSWSVVFPDSNTNGMCVSHEGTIFVGVNRGIYRSRDNGRSWQKVLALDTSSWIRTIIETPTGAILAGSEYSETPNTVPGIFRSTDGGDTWSVIDRDKGLPGTDIDALAAYPYGSSNQTIYATTYMNGACVSYNDGVTWQKIWEISERRGFGAFVSSDPLGVFMGLGWDDVYRYHNNIWRPLGLHHLGLCFTQFSANEILIGTDRGLWLVKFDIIATPVNEPSVVPTDFQVFQNYPNPFNPTTTIKFGVPKASQVTLEIYNILGEKVCALINAENFEPGYWSVNWDGKDNVGLSVPSGIYFYHFVAGEFIKTMKMLLMK